MLCPCGEKTPTGHSLQLITGGKKTFQKLGAGELNSIGTNDPSELNCGGRGIWASTVFCVVIFSMVILVPCGIASVRTTSAPVALTV